MIDIVEVTTAAHLDAVRSLFEEYAASIGVDLCFQGFREEVISLPGKYAAPHGVLLLAGLQSRPVGCVAIRPLDFPDIAELKRLYVRPEARSTGLGKELTRRAIEFAARTGYRTIRLDTLPSMTRAIELYRHMGFRDITEYRFIPVPGAVYMELRLPT